MAFSSMKLKNAVANATDPKLRADNWQYIMDVCDLVREDPEEASDSVVDLVEKVISKGNGNSILRSLSLILSLAENCGSRLQQKIGSKHFSHLLYTELVDNPNSHITIRTETAKMIDTLAKLFANDPSLRYMIDTRNLIMRNYPNLLSDLAKIPASNSHPVIPSKKQDSGYNEDETLQEALRLSLEEFEAEKKRKEQQQKTQDNSASNSNNNAKPTTVPASQPGKPKIRKVRAMYDLTSNEPDELSFKKDDIIRVLDVVYKDWWRGSLRGKIGIFPLNYVVPVQEKTKDELLLEDQQEKNILNKHQEINNLQHILRTSSTDIPNDTSPQINQMYNSVIPLRPQITKMIGKYAEKRDDLLSLHEVLSSAEAEYNKLLNNAANIYGSYQRQPPQQQQQQQQQQDYTQYASPANNGFALGYGMDSRP
ncbi:related to Class E vacuolar protein-sorting machinery protein HSE1 [Saccharomycodes ludwigii]|uniref:Class E vacuolar protein-sorting machinery protein HSE1 n=1 Tax=Saccharomycodes ludwigii TaxID=36035 RepID=A0A376B8C1_9ASCO|nr:related to Class E vacuolar protein-sorting machinery protein HSE1 [Saccharomycodes ludwigii]